MSENSNSADDFSFQFEKIANTLLSAIRIINGTPDKKTQVANAVQNAFEAIGKLFSIDIDIDTFVSNLTKITSSFDEGFFIWSNLGWCLYGCAYDNPECIVPILDEIPENVIGDTTNNSNTEKLNAEIMNYLNDTNAIKNSISNLKKNLSNGDIDKFNESLIDYEKKRYYSCASMLCGIIDSLSIKQCVKDIDSGIITTTSDTSQGFNAFRKVINTHFNSQTPSLSTNDRKDDRHKEIEDRIKKHKFSLLKYYEVSGLLNLIMCMVALFDKFDFNKYKTNKPPIINRNWLAHGMCNLDDITEIDCIKLILILEQLSRLYLKLNSQTDEKK